MKRFINFVIFCFFAIFFVSCDFFTTPIFTSSRDFSSAIQEKSTEEIANNIDKYGSNPEEIASILNELATRDDLEDLSLQDKENILSSFIANVLPMDEVTTELQDFFNDEESEEINIDAMMESIIDSSTQANMTAIQVLLQDEQVLYNGNTYTLALSSIALAMSVINTETKSDESITDEIANLQTMISLSSGETGEYDKDSLKNTLENSDYSEESVQSIIIVMDVLSSLNGTPQDGMPDRSSDTEDISFFGLDLKGFLNDLMGMETE